MCSNTLGQLGLQKELAKDISRPELLPAFTDGDKVDKICAGNP